MNRKLLNGGRQQNHIVFAGELPEEPILGLGHFFSLHEP